MRGRTEMQPVPINTSFFMAGLWSLFQDWLSFFPARDKLTVYRYLSIHILRNLTGVALLYRVYIQLVPCLRVLPYISWAEKSTNEGIKK